jgi:hypothetical protein
MTRDRLQYLLDRYLENTATEEELQEYADWYKQAGEEDIPLFEQADTVQAQEYSKDLFAQIIQKIDAAEKGKKQVYKMGGCSNGGSRCVCFIQTRENKAGSHCSSYETGAAYFKPAYSNNSE